MSNQAKTILSESDVEILKAIKRLIQEHTMQYPAKPNNLWLYDNIYLPVNNRLVDNGIGKRDDGQLS